MEAVWGVNFTAGVVSDATGFEGSLFCDLLLKSADTLAEMADICTLSPASLDMGFEAGGRKGRSSLEMGLKLWAS